MKLTQAKYRTELEHSVANNLIKLVSIIIQKIIYWADNNTIKMPYTTEAYRRDEQIY